jgi:hypothetical protein
VGCPVGRCRCRGMATVPGPTARRWQSLPVPYMNPRPLGYEPNDASLRRTAWSPAGGSGWANAAWFGPDICARLTCYEQSRGASCTIRAHDRVMLRRVLHWPAIRERRAPRDVQDRSSAAPQAAIRAFVQPSPNLSVRRSLVTGVDDSDETARCRPVRRREDQDQQVWPARRKRPAPSPAPLSRAPASRSGAGRPALPGWGYHLGLLGVLRCR